MTQAPLPTLFELTPLNETFRSDPHRLLDDLRSRGPVHPDPVSASLVLTR